MIGRQCDTPIAGTYCAGLQFFTYEAELARVEEKVCHFRSHFGRNNRRCLCRNLLYSHTTTQMSNVRGQVQVLSEYTKVAHWNSMSITWHVRVFTT